ncbi:hypothetical protein EV586_102105 [Tumebacillus sp. BK434]|nr:hypothetical protein EV586_102105 [Tumebacillus sp. BK434]
MKKVVKATVNSTLVEQVKQVKWIGRVSEL